MGKIYSDEELNNMSEEQMRQILKVRSQQVLTVGHRVETCKVKSYLSGWLSLFYFWLISISLSMLSILNNNINFINSDSYESITTKSSSEFHPLWPTYIYGEVILISVIILLVMLVFILTVRRSTKTPLLVLILLGCTAGTNLFSMILTVYIDSELNGSLSDIAITTIIKAVVFIAISIIWSLYWFKSKRVKSTFTKPVPDRTFKADNIAIRIVAMLFYTSSLSSIAIGLFPNDIYYISVLILLIAAPLFFLHWRSKVIQ